MFFIFAAVFIVGVSNVGGATIMNKQACVESCMRGYHAYKRHGKQLSARSWIAGELNNRSQRVFLAYVFDTDLVGQVKLSFAPEVH